MPISSKEIDYLFAVNEEGRFINLILPADKLGPELNLIGKKQLELSIDEIVRVKKYASKLYEDSLR